MPVPPVEIVEVDRDGLAAHPNAIRDIFERRYTGLIIHGAFPRALLSEAMTRLSSGEVTLDRTDVPYFNSRGHILGRPFWTAQSGLDTYLDAVPAFAAGTDRLFGEPLSNLVERYLSRISGDVPVELLKALDGRPYLPATIRVLQEGGALRHHLENETFERNESKGIRERVDQACLMSYYVPLQVPESGGELNVYNLDGLEVREQMRGLDPTRAEALLMQGGFKTLPLDVGDLVVFDAGRRYHEVTPVRGQRTRWTIGGFFAFSKDHDRIFYWC